MNNHEQKPPKKSEVEALADVILELVPESIIPLGIRVLCWFVGFSDSKNMKKFGVTSVPPPDMRCKVTARPYMEPYLESGKRCVRELKAGLSTIGRDLDSFDSILEFGCGCGRIASHLDQELKATYCGTDIDGDLVNWAQQNLDIGTFSTNDPTPPLDYPADSFDLIFSHSVFTHLNEEYQFKWMEELQRVLKPGGILFITIHGEDAWRIGRLAGRKYGMEKLERDRFIFIPRESFRGLAAFQYQSTFHSRSYVDEHFSKYFDILEYIPRGSHDRLDIVLLRKRTEQA